MNDIEQKLDELCEAQLSMNRSITMIAKLIGEQVNITQHLIDSVTQIAILDTNKLAYELANALRKGWIN